MAQVRTRKRGKTFSYIFEAGKIDDLKNQQVTNEMELAKEKLNVHSFRHTHAQC